MNIVGLSKEDLLTSFKDYGLGLENINALWPWIYSRGIVSFEDIISISKSTKATLKEHFSLNRLTVNKSQISQDGTIKLLIKLLDGNEIETVYIPEEDRGTLCVSSQVGCTLNCAFCHTGTQRLVRNLTAAEIVQQVVIIKDLLNDWQSSSNNIPRRVSNIVFMGMGEPMYNYDNVAKAINIIMSDDGIAISRRRITVSTSGIVPQIQKCALELGVNLAVSLHAVTNELRDKLVPINKKYNLEQLIPVCREYQNQSRSRRITFEYTMLKGVNDSVEDAERLIALIENIPCTVNLIPFNPWCGTNFECSDAETIKTFSKILTEAGYYAPVRATRGQDISAACGQLKSESKPVWKSSKTVEV